MIALNEVHRKKFNDYNVFLLPEKSQAIREKAKDLAGKKIVHVNATPRGGGVAEILQSLVPLEQDLGLDSSWYSLEADSKLFAITKKLHNSLQGAESTLSADEKDYFFSYSARLAPFLKELKPDILMIHDPQPLPVIEHLPDNKAALRVHIDLTVPNPDSFKLIEPFLYKYHRVIFSMPQYVPEALAGKAIVSPPAIDPLSEKNRFMPEAELMEICRRLGIDPAKRIIVQVSRFDPWKDPLGVIEAFRLVRKKIKNIQLILAGIIEAQDDPEAITYLQKVKDAAANDPDIILYSDPNEMKGLSIETFTNALQSAAAVILQKSTREGFGLTVTEAMWKQKPVIGGNVGGITLQIENGKNGFLVDSIAEAAEKSMWLLEHRDIAAEMGKQAHNSVAEKFLIPRFLEDEINVMLTL